MSIRIGLYDFFAYALPGIAYIFIAGYWLDVFGIVSIDPAMLSSPSGFLLFLFIGAGYIIGLLLDPLAYSWARLFQSRNRGAVKFAFDEFCSRHGWLKLGFKQEDWGILLRAVKSKSIEAAMDVEQHNVAAIMLRNMSFGLVLISINCLAYFVFISHHIGNLILCGIFFAFSMIAIRRSKIRRHWFYTGIFEAFTAHFLLEEKLENDNRLAREGAQKVQVQAQQESQSPDISPKSKAAKIKIDKSH